MGLDVDVDRGSDSDGVESFDIECDNVNTASAAVACTQVVPFDKGGDADASASCPPAPITKIEMYNKYLREEIHKFTDKNDGYRPDDPKGYYATLGVSFGALQKDVKSGFRDSMLKWHPDKWTTASEADQATAQIKYEKVRQAMDALEWDSMIDFIDMLQPRQQYDLECTKGMETCKEIAQNKADAWESIRKKRETK